MNMLRTLGLIAILSLGVACDRNATNAQGSGQSASGADLQLTVDSTGYRPASLKAPAGKPVRLAITRTSDEGCGQQIVFPSLNLRRDLPLNKVVTVDITMPASGSVAFTCGMDMWRGSIVAQ